MIKKTYIYIGIIFLLVVGCKVFDNTKIEHSNYKVDSPKNADKSIDDIVSPYKRALEAEMNTVIGYAEIDLPKGKPESLLGNWTADAILIQGQKVYGKPIDFAIVNYGGLRIPLLQKGDVTNADIFELMPFDNMLVVIPISGEPLLKLFETIHANGGWPVSSGVKMEFVDDNMKVTINGKPIESDYLFHLVISDYVANGGDNCSFLKPLPRKELGLLFRDALLQYVNNETAQGNKLTSKLENRIAYAK